MMMSLDYDYEDRGDDCDDYFVFKLLDVCKTRMDFYQLFSFQPVMLMPHGHADMDR